jgi:hypothetical protein
MTTLLCFLFDDDCIVNNTGLYKYNMLIPGQRTTGDIFPVVALYGVEMAKICRTVAIIGLLFGIGYAVGHWQGSAAPRRIPFAELEIDRVDEGAFFWSGRAK